FAYTFSTPQHDGDFTLLAGMLDDTRHPANQVVIVRCFPGANVCAEMFEKASVQVPWPRIVSKALPQVVGSRNLESGREHDPVEFSPACVKQPPGACGRCLVGRGIDLSSTIHVSVVEILKRLSNQSCAVKNGIDDLLNDATFPADVTHHGQSS